MVAVAKQLTCAMSAPNTNIDGEGEQYNHSSCREHQHSDGYVELEQQLSSVVGRCRGGIWVACGGIGACWVARLNGLGGNRGHGCLLRLRCGVY